MGVIPTTRVGKIEFYESHLSAWAANAEAIGLTSAQVLALQTLVMTARLVARRRDRQRSLQGHDAELS